MADSLKASCGHTISTDNEFTFQGGTIWLCQCAQICLSPSYRQSGQAQLTKAGQLQLQSRLILLQHGEQCQGTVRFKNLLLFKLLHMVN